MISIQTVSRGLGMNTSKLGFTFGVPLIIVGILVPSSTLIESLRTIPTDLHEQLILGATLFKIGLVILGFIGIALGRMSLWISNFQSEQSFPDSHRKSNLAILAVILIAASALRIYGLNTGLWHDEILTYVQYVRMSFGEIISTYKDQNQHFLYTLLAHASILTFGDSAWSFRLPAVLFGIGSIWALFLLARQVGSVREALLSAALLTFSYHHIWFSQNARGYSGLLFWTNFTSWLFLRALREERPQLWLFYAVAAALGVYTHMNMLFVIMGQFIIYLVLLLVRHKEAHPIRWSGFFLGFCLAGLLTFQLHALALPQILGGMVLEESTVPAWTHPFWTLIEFVKAVKIGFAGSIVATAAVLVFGIGMFSFIRTNPTVVYLLTIPALIAVIAVIGTGHHLWPRFLFFTLGFGALVTVRGIMLMGFPAARLIKWSFANPVVLGTALCVALILASTTSIPLAYEPKQDFLGALNFVGTREEPADAIVTVGLATYAYKNFFKMDWVEVETLDALNSIRSRSKRTWLLYTFPHHMRAVYPEIMAVIKRDFKLIKKFYGTLGDGTIFVLRSDKFSNPVFDGHPPA